MLISTQLIKPMNGIIQQLDWTNLTAFLHPIGLRIRKAKLGDFSLDGKVYEFVARSKSIKVYWKWHFAILLSAVLFKIYMIKFETTTFISLASHIFFVFVFSVYILFVDTYHKKTGRLTHLFNELMSFEKRHIGNNAKEQKYWKKNPMRKLVTMLSNLFRFMLISVPLLFAMSEALVPGAPWRNVPTLFWNAFPTHLVLYGWKLGNTLVVLRSVICFYYTYVLFSILCGYVLMVVVPSVLIPTTMLYFIMEHLLRKLRLSKNLNVDVPHAILMYRDCRLLCDIFNEVHQHVLIPGIIVPGATGTSTFLFVLLSRWDTLDLQSVLLFVNMVSVSGSAITIGFHFCVKLYIESESLVATQGHHFKGRHEKKAFEHVYKKTRLLWRHYWKSFPILSIRFFGGNFFEKATPIVLLDFSIGLAINLLMTDRGSK